MLVCCYRFCRPHVLEWNSVKVSYNEFDIFNEGKIGISFFMKRFYSLIFLPFLTFFFLYVCVFLSLFYVIFSLFKISFWIFPLLSSFFCMFFCHFFFTFDKSVSFFCKNQGPKRYACNCTHLHYSSYYYNGKEMVLLYVQLSFCKIFSQMKTNESWHLV